MKKLLSLCCLLISTTAIAQTLEEKPTTTSTVIPTTEVLAPQETFFSPDKILEPLAEEVVLPEEEILEEENADLGENQELEDPQRDPDGDEEPAPEQNIEPPKPEIPNAFDFLKNSTGNFTTDLFTGSATYNYPLWVPQGRKGMTPSLNFTYSSTQTKLDSLVGYGWSLPTNAIFRSTRKGVDKLYTRNDFTADINGSTAELVVIDQEEGLYGAKTETNFTKYIFTDNHWIATDTKGTKYFFGNQEINRHTNPDNEEEVYKWLLERIEDRNGNFITYTYTQDSGQIYPDTIRYTGHGNDLGVFEIRFVLEERPSYLSYERGFATTTNFTIDQIEIYSLAGEEDELVRLYDLTYDGRNNAIRLLSSLVVRSGETELPATSFTYYDGTENITGKKIDLLKEISFPYGATQRLVYKPSTAYKLGDGSMANGLPFVVHTVVESSLRESPNDPFYTTSYTYEGGHYYFDQLDAYKKEYAGFHKVEITDPIGNVRKMFFHQSEFSPDNEESELWGEYEDHISKKGRIYREEIYDDQENLYQKVIRRWDQNQIPDDDEEKERFFVFQSREVSADYDGNPSYRARAQEMWYDGFGNLVNEIDQGEVILNGENGNYQDIGTDRITAIRSYAQNLNDYLVSYPSRIEKRDQNFLMIGEKIIHYDGFGFGQIEKGNQTMQEGLVSEPGNFIRTKTTYNQYGLPIIFRNAREFQTRVDYNEWNLYPAVIINPLGHETTVHYNITFGIPTEIIDSNGARKRTVLDEFGRIVESFISNPNNPNNEVRIARFEYNLEDFPIHITEIKYPQANIEVFSRTYFDGLARPMQVRAEAENSFVVVNTIYDERGNVKKETLPVFEHGILYMPVDSNAFGNEHAYDALGRRISTMSLLGMTRTEYDNWTQKIWDLNGNQKDFWFDARENLREVWEYLDLIPFVTKYNYDISNNLIQVIDALGNQKNLTYDLLGRKLTEEELHTLNDDTFGAWEYEYDVNNNLISLTDAREQVTNFTYDELDRMVTEDFAGVEGIETTYTYDQGANGIGRLSNVSFLEGEKDFTYDLLGRVSTQAFSVGAQIFVLQFTYDILGNPLTIIYPDGTFVSYTYNGAGQLQTVFQGPDPVILNMDYSPIGSVTQINFANGVETTNTYDIMQLYRLTNKTTTLEEQRLQNISYNYDPVGNVIFITDSSETDTAKMSAYQYDSLYRLIGATITESANGEDYQRNYSYDIIGNMLSKGDIEGAYVYAGNDTQTSPDTIASPHAVTSIGETEYEYDQNGNLITNGIWEHEWDWKDRLNNSVNEDEEITMNYFYDEAKNRILKENVGQGERTYYVDQYYDLENEEGPARRGGKAHIFAGGTKVATLETEGENSIIIYHHEDHLTGSNVDTDLEGEIVQLLDYFPYGDTRIDDHEEGFENDYKFTGKEKDDETGLYYYESRYYDSSIGRFISRDPWEGDLSDPQSLNKYSYVQNNPLKYIDPNGEEKLTVVIEPSVNRNIGHSGVAINNEYWDYGPGENKITLDTIHPFGVKGASYWDSNPRVTKIGDASLKDVFSAVQRGEIAAGKDVYAVTVEITSKQSQIIENYWDDIYKDPGTYHMFGDQCTSRTSESLAKAGLINITRPNWGNFLRQDLGSLLGISNLYNSYKTMEPKAFLNYLQENLVNTEGENKGQPATVQRIDTSSSDNNDE